MLSRNLLEGDKLTRKLPKYHGANVKGNIQSHPILFNNDTGATKTVPSKRFFKKTEKVEKPSTSYSSCLSGGGAPLKELGKPDFVVLLENLTLGNREIVIADIEDDFLLSMDIFKK